MKTKNLLFLCLLLITQLTNAQFFATSPGYIQLKGKVLNAKEKQWKFAQTGFIGNRVYTIDLRSDGSFSSSFPIDGSQSLYLYLNDDAITIFVQPGDIIEMNWDDLDFKNTFKIEGNSQARTKDLSLNMKQYYAFRRSFLALHETLSEIQNKPSSIRNRVFGLVDDSDSTKFRLINDKYNQELKLILADSASFTSSTKRFVTETYYKYSNFLLDYGLFNRYSLVTDNKIVNPENLSIVEKYIPTIIGFKGLNEMIFLNSPEYRDFIYSYVLSSNDIFSITVNSPQTDKTKSIAPSTPGLYDYYCGLACLKIYSIRDWYLTKVILRSFEFYTFEESETALNHFLPICKTQVYKDTLSAFYAKVKKFKTGNTAPHFTLKDETGKLVSLKDFQGKLVYIDFWGVWCAPCRDEIRNYVPKLHEKYAGKDIVFVNICVDVDEKTWKKTLSEIKLDGINLIAEGWSENQVCKDYNINAIPHYVFLDRQGRFINSNMARPSQIVSGQNTTIDKFLMQK